MTLTTTSAMSFLKLQTPPLQFSSVAPPKQQQQPLLIPITTFRNSPFSPLTLCASNSPTPTSASSNPTSLVEEEDEQVPQEDPQPPPASSFDSLPPGACKGCGKLEIEQNCNGQGRIQGGIATVPGFGWWPIKAYRPCPGFVASGGRYRRQGQSMDEVAGLGRELKTPKVTTREAQSSKKKDGPRKFKR